MMGIDSIRYLSIRGIITATRFLVRVAVLFLGDAVDCLMGEIEPSGEGCYLAEGLRDSVEGNFAPQGEPFVTCLTVC